MPRPPASLDETVAAVGAQLAERGVPRPDVLFLMATGTAGVPEHLRHATELRLGDLAGVPAPWDEALLHAGRLGSLCLWVSADLADEPIAAEAQGTAGPASWTGGLPVWLAAAAGAGLCVHTSAGSLLPASAPSTERAVAGIACVRDHVNVSGQTPLLGLGPSALGPLFPDQTTLHHAGLRRAALDHAERLGIPAFEAVAACTLGPALETPAERAMLARLGAEVAVQSLATPLLAAAHAGLACLALVCVAERGPGGTDVAGLIEAARAAEPRLEELLLSLTPELEAALRHREREGP